MAGRVFRVRGLGWGIQAKLLVMMLAVSLLSSLVVGVIGYLAGSDSLRDAALQRLTSVRELRAAEIERYFTNIEAAVSIDSRNASTVAALAAFTAGFDALQNPAPDGVLEYDGAALDAYYEDEFVPELEQRSGQDFDVEALKPTSTAARYLQSNYTAPFDDFDEAIALDDAGDGSAWSAARSQYQAYFRGIITDLGYEDLLLIDLDGDVVYSAYSGVDLGTNVIDGPYGDSPLTDAVTQAVHSNAVNFVATTDFARYQPSLNVPTAWMVSPVGSGADIIGALAIQIPIDQINDVMTGGQQWEQQGFGQTGEVFLIGPDGLMRSLARPLVSDPDTYAERVIAAGTPPDIAERIVAVNGTVLLQPALSHAATLALRGESGIENGASYIGANDLLSYAPLEIEGLDWAIIARVESAEAFAPVNEFTRTIALSTAAIVLLVCLISLLLAQVFVRPLNRLASGVRRVAQGEVGVQVETGTKDEFNDLGIAFNDMSTALQTKQDLLEAQQAENERLLLTLMPEQVAQRYRQGDETIAEDHQDVTVIYADIIGYDEYGRALTSERALAQLNTLLVSFDGAAQRHGIERVRTTRHGYLASCGLIVPRVDNARRTVDFALELNAIVQRFGASIGAELSLRAGIDSGTVTSGLVGSSNVVYDLWGDAVNLAYQVGSTEASPGIFVTQRVADRLPPSIATESSGALAGETVLRVLPGETPA